MQNKGSALAFLFVLLVMCVGAYAAFSALTSDTGARVIAVESTTPAEERGSVTVTATPEATPSPAETPSPGGELSTPVAPSPTPVAAMTPTPVSTSTPTPAPVPTSTRAEPGPPPSVTYQYRVLRNEPDCSRPRFVEGWVYDSAGNGVSGAILSLYAEGWSADPVRSKSPPEAGKYDFPLGSEPARFHLLIVNEGGQPLSPVVDIDYQPNCSYHVDWQRVG